jgi:hypothetical protein
MVWIRDIPLRLFCQRLDLLVVDTIIGQWLDHESSYLIRGLIHWWIHNLMALFWGGGNIERWGLVVESRSMGMCSLDCILSLLPPTTPLLPGWHEASSMLRHMLLSPWYFALTQPKAMDPHDLTLNANLWNCDSKQIHLLCFSQKFCHTHEKLTEQTRSLRWTQWHTPNPITCLLNKA